MFILIQLLHTLVGITSHVIRWTTMILKKISQELKL